MLRNLPGVLLIALSVALIGWSAAGIRAAAAAAGVALLLCSVGLLVDVGPGRDA